MSPRPLLALLVLVLCCAGGFVHAWRTEPGVHAQRGQAEACGCSNPECDCVGVCDCARASCCAAKQAAPAPAEAQPAPALEYATQARPVSSDTLQQGAQPRLRRSRCGSHEKPALASSSGGAPAGLAARTTIPSRLRTRAAHAESLGEATPPSRRPAPPTPPPERA